MSNKQKILIVDDNHINRQLFSMSLRKADFDTTTANDGFQAINLVKLNRFDLVLMDLRMPGIDGYETTNRIKSLPNNKKMPILATSAEDIDKEKQQCFDDFLLKPISPKFLIKKVNEHCIKSNLKPLVFNKEKALQFAYNDKDIMNKIIGLFIIDLPIQISALEDGLLRQDNQTSIDIIHKLRGSCKACGAQELDMQLEKLSYNLKEERSKQELNHQMVKQAVQRYLSTNFVKYQ